MPSAIIQPAPVPGASTQSTDIPSQVQAGGHTEQHPAKPPRPVPSSSLAAKAQELLQREERFEAAPEGRWLGERERPTVLLVLTQGVHAWHAAERRLLAELRTLPIRLVLLPERTELDAELPDAVRRFRAVAGVQALRYGERGVIRVWLERSSMQRGGYRHTEVDFRDANVLQAAVKPIFELVFAWVVQAQLPPPPKASVYAPEYVPLGNLDHGVMLGAGPWFSGGGTSPALNLTFRGRAVLIPVLSLEPELVFQAAEHDVGANGERIGVRLMGMRTHAMFRPWPRATVMAGVGAGLGVLFGRAHAERVKAAQSWSPSVSMRAQLAAPVSPNTALVLAMTAAWGLPKFHFEDRHHHVQLESPALDGLVGVEWQWE